MQIDNKQALSADKAALQGINGSSNGKLNARDRLALLFDADSFIEIEPYVVSRSTRLNTSPLIDHGDGVIAGSGCIGGRPVCAAFQNPDVFGGSVGEAHARKIAKALDLAVKTGVPFISIIDSKGARIQEGIDALNGFSRIVSSCALASGVVPLISVVTGPCTGSAAYIPALSDFVIMVNNKSFICMNSSLSTKAKTNEDNTDQDIGGADANMKFSGLAHLQCEDDNDALNKVKELLDYLPDNNLSDSPFYDDFCVADISDDITSTGSPKNIKTIIEGLTDSSIFFEVNSEYAASILTGFSRFNGRSTGIVANQPENDCGKISGNAARKAARFIRFCDAFNIPILTIVDTEGFSAGIEEEHTGLARYAAQLAFAYSEATVAKIALITGKVNGPAYVAMCSKYTGADMVFAWPTAEVGILPVDTAVAILYKDEIAGATDPAKERAEKEKKYTDEVAGPMSAAHSGYVDEVLTPSATRKKIISAFEILCGKRENRPSKKHDNIPL